MTEETDEEDLITPELEEVSPFREGVRLVGQPVFSISAGAIFLFVILASVFSDQASVLFESIQDWIINTFGWFYALAVAGFLVFAVYLAMSRFGRTRLGPDNVEPEFGFLSWFAMLFSAGMGIGLMFYGVAEPIFHYSAPPVGEGGTVNAAREAVELTLFHWGFHAWSIYAVMGMAIAYFSFRHGLPLTIRSCLYPFLGERVHGPIGQAVDIFAVISTLFGVATSLGFGVMQVNAGLSYLFGIDQNRVVQFLLIAGITAAATISVVSGLSKGVRRLSELNIILAIGLLLFVFVAGPTVFLLQATMQNGGNYLGSLVEQTFNLYAFQPNDWVGAWTLFYWGWWISWAPFVGMFIARVSQGRTIREFVLGVLGVPAILTCLWFTAFGNTAITLDMDMGGAITAAVTDNVATAIFVFFEQLPLSGITTLLATLLVITFFVTSSDSGSLVIDMITSGGDADPPVWTRIFWALTEGLVAAALIAAGGVGALQTAVIAAGLPFAVIMVFICAGLLRSLRIDHSLARRAQTTRPPMTTGGGAAWQQRLKHILNYPARAEAETFLKDVVEPALTKVATEIRETAGFDTTVETGRDAISLNVSHGEELDFRYEVRLRALRRPSFAFPEFTFKNESDTYVRAEVFLLEGPQHYDVLGLTESQLISDVLSQYDMHLHLLHIESPVEHLKRAHEDTEAA